MAFSDIFGRGAVVVTKAPEAAKSGFLAFLEWRASQYDIGAITGTLGVEDLARKVPYVTFDGRFKGLWP